LKIHRFENLKININAGNASLIFKFSNHFSNLQIFKFSNHV